MRMQTDMYGTAYRCQTHPKAVFSDLVLLQGKGLDAAAAAVRVSGLELGGLAGSLSAGHHTSLPVHSHVPVEPSSACTHSSPCALSYTVTTGHAVLPQHAPSTATQYNCLLGCSTSKVAPMGVILRASRPRGSIGCILTEKGCKEAANAADCVCA